MEDALINEALAHRGDLGCKRGYRFYKNHKEDILIVRHKKYYADIEQTRKYYREMLYTNLFFVVHVKNNI